KKARFSDHWAREILKIGSRGSLAPRADVARVARAAPAADCLRKSRRVNMSGSGGLNEMAQAIVGITSWLVRSSRAFAGRGRGAVSLPGASASLGRSGAAPRASTD